MSTGCLCEFLLGLVGEVRGEGELKMGWGRKIANKVFIGDDLRV